MDSVPTEISRWSDNYLNLDNLIRQIFQHKSSEGSFASVENHPAVRSALVDFYNDFRTYKDALKEIKKVQSEVANVQIKGNLKINQKSPINSLIKEKYTLLRPISLLSQRKSKLNEERRIQGCILPDKLQKSASDSELQSSSSSK